MAMHINEPGKKYDLREILRKKHVDAHLNDPRVIAAGEVRAGQSFRKIKADDLGIDHRYQRPLSEASVNRIAKQFDPKLFGVVTVSERGDGTFWIVDGQHRVAAIRKMGNGQTEIPCEVLTSLSYEEEANVFHKRNAWKKTMTPQDKFRGALQSGDETAHRINETVSASGYAVNLETSELHGGKIPAIAALQYVDKQYREGHLLLTIGLIRDIWGTDTGPRGTLITGVAYFLSLYRDIASRRRFIERMSTQTMDHLYSEAKEYRSKTKVERDVAMCSVLVGYYNFKMHKENQLLDPITMAAVVKMKGKQDGN